ncbi:hypothetical protein [Pontibacter fetidus]|uniref:Uncharacterized protein n=1 Tax=Pontibacter fetidus TaxID=2700082 RepID=A0A6B2H6S6_9BACT|nr:hypothetical protein [Pontibacter fetidus]NDK54764.1 hypothetical protein [Pontibacter fetidus]
MWSCDKADEAVKPEALTATKGQTIKSGKEKENKDVKYKSDKTGQYVSKDVQVTGYEDGRERPTRPKYDAAGTIRANYMDPCDDCGGTGGLPASTFVTSESLGGVGAIYDLKVIKGSSSSIEPTDLPGYYKIPVDLNRGAGGKYIYLCFTRDNTKVQGSSNWVDTYSMGKNVPVRGIEVVLQTVGTTPKFYDTNLPGIEVKDALGFHIPDLNDGASGKYIYAYQQKGAEEDPYNPTLPVIIEVGVIYGNSSTIEPPLPLD